MQETDAEVLAECQGYGIVYRVIRPGRPARGHEETLSEWRGRVYLGGLFDDQHGLRRLGRHQVGDVAKSQAFASDPPGAEHDKVT